MNQFLYSKKRQLTWTLHFRLDHSSLFGAKHWCAIRSFTTLSPNNIRKSATPRPEITFSIKNSDHHEHNRRVSDISSHVGPSVRRPTLSTLIFHVLFSFPSFRSLFCAQKFSANSTVQILSQKSICRQSELIRFFTFTKFSSFSVVEGRLER